MPNQCTATEKHVFSAESKLVVVIPDRILTWLLIAACERE
jgi:hypothetical protein